jgi:hypothetical protein
MTLTVQPYLEQLSYWPRTGRHILAQFDEESIVVYQAFRPSIALHATQNQRFGGDFSFNRMSWIKPGFLWTMYRSGWATKEGQEHILAVRLNRSFFEELLASAIPANFRTDNNLTHRRLETGLNRSDVLLQWDPDHDPHGVRAQRRAAQIGLRGEMLRRYGQSAILSVEDITPFVAEQRSLRKKRLFNLHTPAERLYMPAAETTRQTIGID